jgi:hypothetical protein
MLARAGLDSSAYQGQSKHCCFGDSAGQVVTGDSDRQVVIGDMMGG